MDYVYNICQTCLSDGRQLYPLRVLRNLLPELECYFEEIKESIGGVCWECRSHILKFFKFKAKVRIAQNTMWDLKDNKQNGTLSSVSTLSVSYKQTYDYIYTFNEEIEIKTEPTFIKQETDISDCEMDDVKTDIDIDESINFEFVNTVKQDTVQSDEGNIIVPKLEILDDIEITYSDGENDEQTKFSKVIFTEEEMQECREIKRSQPNFKTLPLKCCDCVLGFKRKDKYDLHMEKKHDLKAGSFLCDICKIRFPSDFELAQHRNKHYKGYKCKLCHYKSTLCNAIRGHCSSQHKVDTVNKIHCKYCKVIVETVEKLTEHIEEMHNFSCDKCPVTLRRKQALRKHKRQMHGSKRRLICDICARTFVNKTRLESHMMTHDDGIAKQLSYCTECDIQYKSISVYRDHLRKSVTHSNKLRMHGSQRRLICDICTRTFVNKARLESHMVTHDDGIAKQLSYCAECDIQYKSVNVYRDHLRKSVTHSNKLRMHGSKKRLICDICARTFVNKAQLESHMITTHDEGIAKQLSYCAECDIQYKNIYVYRDHLRKSVTHSNKLFQCSDCDKKFASQAYWQQHRNICQLRNDRRKCKLCNEVFKSKRHLTKHNIVRHGVTRTRNHPCGECGKSFFDKNTLNEHMNSHTGNRPYACETCGATFSYSAALYTHKKKHKRCRAIREQQTATAETNSESNVDHKVN